MSTTDFDARFELCLKEVELVQDQISRYDSNGFAVKSWTVATCSGLIAYAVAHQLMLVGIIAALVALAFATVELVYRCFQSRFIARAVELEAVLATEDLANYRYALPSAASKACWPVEVRKTIRLPHFVLLYVLFIVLGLALALALEMEWLPALPNLSKGS